MTRIIFFTIVVSSMCLWCLSACTSYNEEEYFGYVCDTTQINRDTIEVYYDDLTPIFTGICASCHNQQSSERSEIRMDTYEGVKASFETGLPWPAINHTGEYQMPYNLPKLEDCDIQRIGAWVSNGMPEKVAE